MWRRRWRWARRVDLSDTHVFHKCNSREEEVAALPGVWIICRLRAAILEDGERHVEAIYVLESESNGARQRHGVARQIRGGFGVVVPSALRGRCEVGAAIFRSPDSNLRLHLLRRLVAYKAVNFELLVISWHHKHAFPIDKWLRVIKVIESEVKRIEDHLFPVGLALKAKLKIDAAIVFQIDLAKLSEYCG